ncbi:hypothetical protein ACHAP5_006920 [Fusarium lateritium]
MSSHKIFAAFTALAFIITSEASPCRPVSSVVTSATFSSVVAESTTATSIEATSTIDVTSAGTTTTYATDVTITESETVSTEAATDATTAIESVSTEATTTMIAPSTTTAEASSETLLITNGDFETGNAAPWSSTGLGAVVAVITTDSHGGAFSLVLGSQASDPVITTQTLDKSLLVAMQPYRLSLYAKVSDSTSCSSGITMFVDDGSQNSPFGTKVVVPGSQLENDWTYVSGEFTLTEAALSGSGTLRFYFKTKCNNGFFAYVDDVKMELAN